MTSFGGSIAQGYAQGLDDNTARQMNAIKMAAAIRQAQEEKQQFQDTEQFEGEAGAGARKMAMAAQMIPATPAPGQPSVPMAAPPQGPIPPWHPAAAAHLRMPAYGVQNGQVIGMPAQGAPVPMNPQQVDQLRKAGMPGLPPYTDPNKAPAPTAAPQAATGLIEPKVTSEAEKSSSKETTQDFTLAGAAKAIMDGNPGISDRHLYHALSLMQPLMTPTMKQQMQELGLKFKEQAQEDRDKEWQKNRDAAAKRMRMYQQAHPTKQFVTAAGPDGTQIIYEGDKINNTLRKTGVIGDDGKLVLDSEGHVAAVSKTAPLTKESISFNARRGLAGVPLNQLAGTPAGRTQVMNEMAKEAKKIGMSPEDVARQQSKLKAYSSSATGMAKLESSITMQEDTAKGSIGLIREQLKNPDIKNFDIKAFNKAFQAGELMTGNTPTAVLTNQIITLQEEYAKVMTGATGIGAATDSARSTSQQLVDMTNVNALPDILKNMESEMAIKKAAITKAKNDAFAAETSGVHWESPFFDPEPAATSDSSGWGIEEAP